MTVRTPWPLAEISPNGLYRYCLSRQWDATGATVAFIGLNPSTADASQDDPTIRRCVGFAKAWGAGSLVMVNLFAFRSTDPSLLKTASDPIGPENDEWLHRVVSEAHTVVAAWGNHGSLLGRHEVVLQKHGARLSALAITKTGMPKHPLYIKADARPFLLGRRTA